MTIAAAHVTGQEALGTAAGLEVLAAAKGHGIKAAISLGEDAVALGDVVAVGGGGVHRGHVLSIRAYSAESTLPENFFSLFRGAVLQLREPREGVLIPSAQQVASMNDGAELALNRGRDEAANRELRDNSILTSAARLRAYKLPGLGDADYLEGGGLGGRCVHALSIHAYESRSRVLRNFLFYGWLEITRYPRHKTLCQGL